MFAYGVMNAVQTEDTELSFNYQWDFTDREIYEINEKYDAYLVPMADAFRVRFQKQLSGLTRAIQKLRIPVIVIGVAVRTSYEPDFSKGFEFDECAKAFVKAVLDKGSVIGVRGDITCKYLAKLGFVEERDYTAIGCPSLYTYGTGTRTKSLPSQVKRLAMNTNGYYNVGHINEFLLNTARAIPDYCLIQQQQSEYRDMYLGKAWLPT